MPELFLIYIAGSLLTYLLTLVFTYIQFSRYTKPQYKQVNLNLKKVGFRYSEVESKAVKTSDENFELSEINKARLTYFILSFFATLLSWAGLIIIILVWISLKFLIKNRMWQELQNAEISRKDLTESEIRLEIERIKSLGFDSGFE